MLGQAEAWPRLDLREREKRGILREEKVRPASTASGGRWASESSSCSHGYGDSTWWKREKFRNLDLVNLKTIVRGEVKKDSPTPGETRIDDVAIIYHR